MDDALFQTKHPFAQELVSSRKLDIEPLLADQWVTISLLQKSIRRGELETAQRAAFTLFAQKGSAIWRRFIVIAFEDVGAASPDAVAMTVAASTDSSWRRKNGGDLHIAVQLARVLAEAQKSRSAEHLVTGAQHHPSLGRSRMLRRAGSLTDHFDTITDRKASLTERARGVVRVRYGLPKRRKRRKPTCLRFSIRLGLVASLNRPGGNVTGVTHTNVEMAPKRLQLLHELVPTASVIALLVNPANPTTAETNTKELQAAARALGFELHVLNAVPTVTLMESSQS